MTTYYVGPVGSGTDTGSGTDPAQAMSLAALQSRIATLQPGDTVLFLGGVYRNTTFNDGNIWKDPLDLVLRIKDVQGTAEAPITFAAAPGEHVSVQFDGAGGIRVTQSQHVKIQGFDIGGPNQDITLQEALSDQFAYRIDRVNGPTLYRDPAQDLGVGNSIASQGGEKPEYYHSSGIAIGNAANHIEIVDNRVHDAPGYGMSSLGGADYLTIKNNVVYNNAWWGGGNHGISVQNAVSSDPFVGNKIIIDGNTLSDNYAKTISWATLKTEPVTMVLDEGKGIHLQENESATGFTSGEILIANNLIVRSGNAGITESLSERVNIINNSLIDNGYINTLMSLGLTDPKVEAGFSVKAGGLRLAGGSDVTVVNNLISVSDATLNVVDATTGLTADNASFTNNLYTGGTGLFLRSGDTTLAWDLMRSRRQVLSTQRRATIGSQPRHPPSMPAALSWDRRRISMVTRALTAWSMSAH